MKDLVIAVDFDGTCVRHAYPEVGESVGAEPVLRRMVEHGAHLILWTMRHGENLRAAEQWFKDRSIPLHGVQKNPTQHTWTRSPKAYAHIYIDDAALGCPLVYPEDGYRPYVDWAEVERMLFPTE